MPFTFADKVRLVQLQVTPAHLDEARGLELYGLVQELQSDKSSTQGEQVGAESCCHREHVVCYAKARFLHSMPANIVSFLTRDTEQKGEDNEPVDFVGVVMEHEFLFHETIVEAEDSTPTSSIISEEWFKWISALLSPSENDKLEQAPIDDEPTNISPVDSPTSAPEIFPLDTTGEYHEPPQENASEPVTFVPTTTASWTLWYKLCVKYASTVTTNTAASGVKRLLRSMHQNG
jgi:hypothetical protein